MKVCTLKIQICFIGFTAVLKKELLEKGRKCWYCLVLLAFFNAKTDDFRV